MADETESDSADWLAESMELEMVESWGNEMELLTEFFVAVLMAYFLVGEKEIWKADD